jgi:hypothetical protein
MSYLAAVLALLPLVFFVFLLVMAFKAYRAARQRGQWSWTLFLGLIASVPAYVGLFLLPVASSTALQTHRVWLALILVGGTFLYAGAAIYFIRRIAAKMKTGSQP